MFIPGIVASMVDAATPPPETFYAEVIADAFATNLSFRINQIGEVDWGDGSFSAVAANVINTSNALSPGPVVIKSVNSPTKVEFSPTGSGTNIKEIDIINSSTLTIATNMALGQSALTTFTIADASNITTYNTAWKNCTNLTSFNVTNLDMSAGTSFFETWRNCSSLLSFPAVDMSASENVAGSWRECAGLTAFPQLDISSAYVGTTHNASNAWQDCSGLLSFPLIDFGKTSLYVNTWLGNTSLTTMPLIDVSKGTNFNGTWQNCTGLLSMPAINTILGTSFTGTFNGCSSLICLSALDTRIQTGTTGLFTGTTALVAPNGAEQTALLTGSLYSNGGACP